MAPCLVDSLAVATNCPLFSIGICHAAVVMRQVVLAFPVLVLVVFQKVKGVGVPLPFGETLR